MKAFAKLFLVLLLSFGLTGCAAKGLKFSEFSSQMPDLSPEMGRIYFYRVTVMGAAVQPSVKINDEVIGKAVPKGFFYVDKEPGNYEIMTSTEVKRKLSLTLDAGQTRYVRLGISIGFFVGHVYPELVDSDVGAEEIQKCKHIEEKE